MWLKIHSRNLAAEANLKMSKKSIGIIALRLGMIAISIIVALLVIEGVLRLTGIGPGTAIFNNYRFDEVLGWDTKPGFSWVSTRDPTPHTNHYNPDGLPSLEQDADRSLSRITPTIAFVGDSFTEGYYLPYEETFTHLVGERFPGKQVLNLGVVAYAPDQYLLKARRHLPDYNVDTIVVMFFPGDDIRSVTKQSLGGYSKPYFEGSFDTPLNTPLTDQAFPATQSLPRKIHRHSALVRAITPALIEYVPWMVDYLAGHGGSVYYYDEEEMRKALRLIQQIGFEFPADDFVTYYVPFLKEVQDQRIFEQNSRLYESLCDELAMRCLTLEPALAQAPDPEDFFIERDGHFTRLGAELVANQIYDDLITANGVTDGEK